MTLYVGLYSDWESAKKKFNFYPSIEDLNHNVIGQPDDEMQGSWGTTWLVRPKKPGSDAGVLILLNDGVLVENYSLLFDLIAHESGHATDAVFQYVGGNITNFDGGNENYMYLLGWIAGRVGEYLIKCVEDGR